MSTTTSTSGTAAPDALRFEVEVARCIGCVACLNLFPHLFVLRDDGSAISVGTAIAGEVPVTRVTGCCPVGAIRLVAGADRPAGPRLEPVPGWEAEWEVRRRVREDPLDRERRYGRVHRLLRLGDIFDLCIELPRDPPVHPDVCRVGIPTGPPGYECSVVQLAPDVLSARARLVDPTLRHLAGKLNSLPLGFKVDYRFPIAVGAAFLRLDLHSLHVYAVPAGPTDPKAALAAAIRDQLAES